MLDGTFFPTVNKNPTSFQRPVTQKIAEKGSAPGPNVTFTNPKHMTANDWSTYLRKIPPQKQGLFIRPCVGQPYGY